MMLLLLREIVKGIVPSQSIGGQGMSISLARRISISTEKFWSEIAE